MGQRTQPIFSSPDTSSPGIRSKKCYVIESVMLKSKNKFSEMIILASFKHRNCKTYFLLSNN
jgi:hypothetical protein